MFYVLSLGGSIVAPPEGVDVNFLRKFKKLVESRVEKGDRFIIVVGGGGIARDYVKNAFKVNKEVSVINKDYIGIFATRLNAFLVKSIFAENAYKDLILDPNIKIKTNKPLIFSGGYEPGNSSDYVAVLLAETYGIKEVINLSNIDYIYDKDPSKFSDAKKIEKINWNDFLDIIGREWVPGLNVPFDPVASLRCQKKGKKVVAINGRNLKNLENYLLGKNFKGTEIFDDF